MQKDVGAQDHKQTLAETARNLAVFEVADVEKLFLGEIDADFLPRLTHRRIQTVFVFFIAASTRERDM